MHSAQTCAIHTCDITLKPEKLTINVIIYLFEMAWKLEEIMLYFKKSKRTTNSIKTITILQLHGINDHRRKLPIEYANHKPN